jgi:hypothetical protein
MKWSVPFLFAAALCFGGQAPGTSREQTFTGVIHDNRCMGPNCATQCPITKEPRFTLQSGDEAWLLSDQKAPARYVGRKVIVTGTVEGHNKLNLKSIAPAR